MLEPAVVVLRFVQYGSAAILFGTPLFLLYGLRGGERPVQDLLWPGWALSLRWLRNRPGTPGWSGA